MNYYSITLIVLSINAISSSVSSYFLYSCLLYTSRYFHLNETIQKNREALKFLRERAEPAAPSLNGMPHASGVKDSTGRLAVEIADMDARITYLEEQAEQERDKAVTFCSTIQDARLYLIFRLRFVRCLTWAEVADLLGDYYTEEGVCRMAYRCV